MSPKHRKRTRQGNKIRKKDAVIGSRKWHNDLTCGLLCECVRLNPYVHKGNVNLSTCWYWVLTNPPVLSTGKICCCVPAQPTCVLLVWFYLWAARSLGGHSLPSSDLVHVEWLEERMVALHRTVFGDLCCHSYIIRLLVPCELLEFSGKKVCPHLRQIELPLGQWFLPSPFDVLDNNSPALLNENTYSAYITLETVEWTQPFFF